MNAFMIFARKRRPEVSAANVSMRTGEISKILSKEWNSMSTVGHTFIAARQAANVCHRLIKIEKQYYQDQAKKLKDVFNNRYPDYVYRRRPNNSRKKRRASDASALGGQDELSPDTQEDLTLNEADESVPADLADPAVLAGYPYATAIDRTRVSPTISKYTNHPWNPTSRTALYGYSPPPSYTHSGRDPYPIPQRRSPETPYTLSLSSRPQSYPHGNNQRSHTPSPVRYSEDSGLSASGAWFPASVATAQAPNQVSLSEAPPTNPGAGSSRPASGSWPGVDLAAAAVGARSSSAGSSNGSGSQVSQPHTHTHPHPHAQGPFAPAARAWPDMAPSSAQGTSPTAAGSFFPTLSSPFYPSQPQAQAQGQGRAPATAPRAYDFQPAEPGPSMGAGAGRQQNDAYAHPHSPVYTHSPAVEHAAAYTLSRSGGEAGSTGADARGEHGAHPRPLAPVLQPLSTSTYVMNPPPGTSPPGHPPTAAATGLEFWQR
jgi:hypothetical protein